MIFGKLEIGETALHTSNDSHALDRLSGATTRRPFLGAGLVTACPVAAFGWSFWDILMPDERVFVILITSGAALAGLTIGQLTLVSADLRGSPLADTVFGTYRHLNRLRPQIIEAAHRARKAEGRA